MPVGPPSYRRRSRDPRPRRDDSRRRSHDSRSRRNDFGQSRRGYYNRDYYRAVTRRYESQERYYKERQEARKARRRAEILKDVEPQSTHKRTFQTNDNRLFTATIKDVVLSRRSGLGSVTTRTERRTLCVRAGRLVEKHATENLLQNYAPKKPLNRRIRFKPTLPQRELDRRRRQAENVKQYNLGRTGVKVLNGANGNNGVKSRKRSRSESKSTSSDLSSSDEESEGEEFLGDLSRLRDLAEKHLRGKKTRRAGKKHKKSGKEDH